MKKQRTFAERVTQLGSIAIHENHPKMPRTNKAKHILWEYEKNVFGSVLTAEDFCLGGKYKNIWENKKFTTKQFQGR